MMNDKEKISDEEKTDNAETVEKETANPPPQRGADSFWKIAVVVLFILVAAQTGMMLKFAENKKNSPPPPSPKTDENEVVLKPRPVATPSRTTARTRNQPRTATARQLSLNSGPAPQPLPHLNVNVNPRNGGAPVITAMRQQPTRQAAPPQNSTQRNFFASGRPGAGVSIHISQTPFGPSFATDIRGKIAEMERMMNAMMGSSFSGAGTGFPIPPRMGKMTGGTPSTSNGKASFGISSSSVKEENGNYVVRLKVPGLDQTQVDAKVQDGILFVSGTQREETTQQGNGVVSFSTSITGFHRPFPLPGPVDADKIKLTYDKKKELLTVRIPKKK